MPVGTFWRLCLSLILALGLVSCQSLPFLSSGPTATPTLSVLEPSPEAESTSLPTSTPEAAPPDVLRIWLPPQFDPANGSPAGDLLQERLDSFASIHPEVTLDVRLKAESGSGGLLASLSAAHVSAPTTLPDVVALPRPLLESAALKGVIYPWDDLSDVLDSSDWYPYAYQLAQVQERTFGLPFAGDLLLMVYNPAALPSPPVDWASLLESGQVLVFPAASEQALFTLLQYQAVGGEIIDVDGRPFLDSSLLEQVLDLYLQARVREIFPARIGLIETDQQNWESFIAGEAGMLVAWSSHYLGQYQQLEVPLVATSLPGSSGPITALATGWAWALASPYPGQRGLAAELAEFLTDSAFLAEWNAALGMIPPRLSAMALWEPLVPAASFPLAVLPTPTGEADNTATPSPTQTPVPVIPFRDLAASLSASAELLPSGDLLAVLGPPLRQAALDMINQQALPGAAAEAAASALGNP
jgi:multiple sugar transport system substrate-binding protein